ncbi:hypothetical protein D4R99_04240 [bacterium]|nr:MAG: hypothetical protein D4R99_04240 [bacterium]
MKKKILSLLVVGLTLFLIACEPPSSDEIQRQQQETILKEGTSSVGMPAIKNFRERKILKDILELRDQDGLVTYTYLFNELNGNLIFLCDSIGYGIPYATQYTNPQKIDHSYSAYQVLPQADPNGLFSPASAEGTWVLCKNPNGKDVAPLYIEPKIIVSPFPLGSKAVTLAPSATSDKVSGTSHDVPQAKHK